MVRTDEERTIASQVCFPANGEGRACTEKDGDDVDHQTACGDSDKSTTFSVFDLTKGTRFLRLTHDEGMDSATKAEERTRLTVEGKALSIKGPGCNEMIAFVVSPASKASDPR